jgi:hypothetical protein
MKPPKLTGNRWQCPTCGDYFGSVRGFDRHRVGAVGMARHCLTEVELFDAGWLRSVRGFLLTPDRRRAGAGLEGQHAPSPAGHQGAIP